MPTEHIPSAIWTLPFAALLLAIAVLPLIHRANEWWEHHNHKLIVGLTLGAIVLAYYTFRGYGVHGEEGHPPSAPGWHTLVAIAGHAVLEEYVPFMTLLFSLYVISGGLQLKGDLLAKPIVNTALLATGALLASLIGTTGASMLMIRPLLQTNRDRTHVRHTVIFFIFLVSNVGGCLLPLGDPPLFLGYLRGVPFLWTTNLVLPWLFCVITLLVVYFIWDTLAVRKEPAEFKSRDIQHLSPLRLNGAINLIWLAGVVMAVALIVPGRPLPGTDLIVADFVREGVMLVLTVLSLASTPRGLRKEVEFSYGAIIEVACLFLGIFITMQVPIEILSARGAALGLNTPAHFFWATGILSSVLDNAPTYVVFFETAHSLAIDPASATVKLIDESLISANLLKAISLGSVFMGANTYIGNGPNFMVKSIAESRGIKMPGFFGYMAYSGAVLIPLFIVVTLLFFR